MPLLDALEDLQAQREGYLINTNKKKESKR